MLVLSRKLGEKIRVSHDDWVEPITIEVGRFTPDESVRLHISAPRGVAIVPLYNLMKPGDTFTLSSRAWEYEIRVTLASIRGGLIRVGIDAPKDVEIMRVELLK